MEPAARAERRPDGNQGPKSSIKARPSTPTAATRTGTSGPSVAASGWQVTERGLQGLTLAGQGGSKGSANIEPLSYTSTMQPFMTIPEAHIAALDPLTFVVRVSLNDAHLLRLPRPWFHADNLDQFGSATFVHPVRQAARLALSGW